MELLKNYRLVILITAISMFFFACSEDESENIITGLEIHAINVGQGDCTLIISPNGKSVLIDAGNNGKGRTEVVPYLNSLGIDSLTYIVATHYDADHIGGIDDVLDEIPVSRSVFDHGGYNTTATYDDYIAAIGSKRQTMETGEGYMINLGGGVEFDCVMSNANGMDVEAENDRSICLVIRYEDFEYFVSGDISGYDHMEYTDIETVVAPSVGQVEGFKVNHHGSRYSSNPFFLETIDPIFAVISCGSNAFGHPSPDAMDRINNAGTMIYQTAADDGTPIDNDIRISTDGAAIQVRTSIANDEYSCY